ncbi:MAG: type II toxin-antitoxin system PemK/MazF family toxin [Chloroflexus sp.]
MNTLENARRGEIWQADLGAGHSMLVLVVSTNALSSLPLRLVAPLQPWDDRFAKMIWIQRLEGNWPTQLGAPHAVDLLQLRSIELTCFRKRIGRVPAVKMDEIAAAIALVVDFQVPNAPV